MHTCRMTQQKPETACSRSSRHGPEHPVACMADLADVLGRDEALGERKVARVHLPLPPRWMASVRIIAPAKKRSTSPRHFTCKKETPRRATDLTCFIHCNFTQRTHVPRVAFRLVLGLSRARLCVGSMGGLVSTAGAGDAGVCPRAVSALIYVSALARERTRPL